MCTLRRTLSFTFMVCLLAGCQSVDRPASPRHAPDMIHFAGHPPVFLFMPIIAPDMKGDQGYIAEIVLPRDRSFTTERIEVTVQGSVASPGNVRLRSGATVLEAVISAGGFEPWAGTKRLEVSQSSGQRVRLYFHSRRTAGANFRLVWCDTTKNDTGPVPASDYVLDAGDWIVFLTALY